MMDHAGPHGLHVYVLSDRGDFYRLHLLIFVQNLEHIALLVVAADPVKKCRTKV